VLVRVLGIFTSVERALQISPFMQNEPNFRKSQMKVNKVLTKDYEKRTLGERGKNEPKTNPNEPNLSRRSRIKANFTSAQRPAIAVRSPALKERSDNKGHFVTCWKY